MEECLFVAWQDASTRSWHTVAKLTRIQNEYEFAFTEGARRLKDIPTQLFSMPLRGRYRFSSLIPLFQNRLPARKRADFLQFLDWLDLTGNEDEFTQLGKFGLIPGTDSLLMYPCPKIKKNRYELDFFVHGIRHMGDDASNRCKSLTSGEQLFAMFDVQNPVDQNAVALRTADQCLIGYVPTFYASDFRRIFDDAKAILNSQIVVRKCNQMAPAQMRLLCRIDAFVEDKFTALDTPSHQPISAGELTLAAG